MVTYDLTSGVDFLNPKHVAKELAEVFFEKDVDNGPIIDQRVVEVSDSDTPESLEEKIHEEEHIALVYSINLLITKRYSINGKRVIRE